MTECQRWYGPESRNVRCKHPDCKYRNFGHGDEHRCDYMLITGKTRTEGLTGEDRLPCNCTKYESLKPSKNKTGKTPPVRIFGEFLPRTPRPYPAWYEQAKAMNAEGMTNKEIAAELGKSSTVVAEVLRKLGVKYNRKVSPPNFDTNKAYELWQAGKLDTIIGKELGVPAPTIQNWRARNGLHSNYNGGIGRKHSE